MSNKTMIDYQQHTHPAHEVKNYPPLIIDHVAQEILDISAKPPFDIERVDALLKSIIESPNSSGLSELIALQLSWRRLSSLTPEAIENLMHRFSAKLAFDQNLADLQLGINHVAHDLARFCTPGEEGRKSAYSQISLNIAGTSAGKSIFDFACRELALNCKSSHPQANWKFEAYTHPTDKLPGVWMSRAGAEFDEGILIKMMKADEDLFASEYLSPVAHKAIRTTVKVQ